MNKGESCERASGEPAPCAKRASIGLDMLFLLLLLLMLFVGEAAEVVEVGVEEVALVVAAEVESLDEVSILSSFVVMLCELLVFALPEVEGEGVERELGTDGGEVIGGMEKRLADGVSAGIAPRV